MKLLISERIISCKTKTNGFEDAVNRFRKGSHEIQSELANAAHGTFLDASRKFGFAADELVLRYTASNSYKQGSKYLRKDF